MTEEEISDTIRNGFPIAAKYGRLAKVKVFSYDSERLGKHYEQKKVEIIFIIENNTIIVVTVYAYYGKWGENDANSV